MRAMTGGRGSGAGLVPCAGAIIFAIAASVGNAVSPAVGGHKHGKKGSGGKRR